MKVATGRKSLEERKRNEFCNYPSEKSTLNSKETTENKRKTTTRASTRFGKKFQNTAAQRGFEGSWVGS